MCARLEPGSTRPAWTAATAAWWAAACWPLPLLELGLLWILECLWRELNTDHEIMQQGRCLPGELVRARETFCATGESAGMGLLSRVSADVTGLVLQTVEGLVTEGALVRTGEVLARLLLGLLLLQEGSHEAHGSSSHGR